MSVGVPITTASTSGRAMAAIGSVIASVPSAFGQRLDRVGEGIGDGDELRLGVRRDAGGVDLADPPGAENCNSYHRGFLVPSVREAHRARIWVGSVRGQVDGAELLHRRVERPLRGDLERQVAMVAPR